MEWRGRDEMAMLWPKRTLGALTDDDVEALVRAFSGQLFEGVFDDAKDHILSTLEDAAQSDRDLDAEFGGRGLSIGVTPETPYRARDTAEKIERLPEDVCKVLLGWLWGGHDGRRVWEDARE